MEEIAFKDKNQKPTDELIKNALAENFTIWNELFSRLKKDFPDAVPGWNYYNDGKSWLLKTVKKNKTLFWTAIFPGSFSVTFYFGDKAASLIDASDIADDLKDQYHNGKHFGKIRAVSLRVHSGADVENIMKLADLRSRIK